MSAADDECAAFGPLLEAFYYHTLDEDQAHTVAEHTAACASCSAALERFAEIDRLIADAPMPAPGPELRQRLAARIAVARAHRPAQSGASAPITRESIVRKFYDDDPNHSEQTRASTPSARAGKVRQRARIWLGTAAAVLVVAMLAGVFVTKMNGTSNQANLGPNSGPAASGACSADTIKAQLPAHTWLSDLAMVSPDEGWAVGWISSDRGVSGHATPSPETPPGSSSGVIMHFHNCTWTALATKYPGTRFSSISMDSANDGWIVGGTLEKPLALHYTNGAWTRVALPVQNASQGHNASQDGYWLGLVRMRSADEGWIVVESYTGPNATPSSALLHLVNGQWSAVTMPLETVGDALPVGQDEAWFTGSPSDGPMTSALYHYRAGQWTRATLPSGVFIDHLRMDSPTDIWASAHTVVMPPNSEGGQSMAAALHYDGTTWTPVNLGSGGQAQLIQIFAANAAWAFSRQRTDAGETITGMQYGGGNTWQAVQLPATDLLVVDPLVRVAPDEYWAIGPSAVAGRDSALLYFVNGVWHTYGR